MNKLAKLLRQAYKNKKADKDILKDRKKRRSYERRVWKKRTGQKSFNDWIDAYEATIEERPEP